MIISFGRRLIVGLAGGLSAALVLSVLDWWLLLRGDGRGMDGQSVAALCYAFLLLGAAGAVGGVGLALLGLVLGRLTAPWRCGRFLPQLFSNRIIGALCVAGGGVLLIRFGWMPHWFRSGGQRSGPSGPWLISLLVGLALLVALLPELAKRLRRRSGDHPRPQGTGRLAGVMVFLLLLLYGAAATGWALGGPTGDSPPAVRSVPVHPVANRAAPPGDETSSLGPSVVVLLLDTLRWDALSCYGNDQRLSPHLDRFCREAVQFEVARAQASWTKPSIATLLTSTQPRQHGARGRADRIRSSTPLLAGLFRRAGYRTGAVVANGNLSPAFGFARGFDDYHYLRPDFALGARGRALNLGVYRIASVAWQLVARGHRDHRHFKRDAAEVNDAVLAWLDRLNPAEREPFFLFVNYVDPHDPYFRHPYDGWALGAVDGKAPALRVREEMAALYDGEVAFLDHHLGRLFAHLRRLGLYERSVIVVTSDHGEEFLDHGGWWHGLTLFEEQVRVPLMVRVPGGMGNRLAGRAAGLIDVAPSLLELAGLGDLIPEAMTGQNMVCVFGDGGAGGMEAPRPFLADETLDGNILTSLTEGRWKFVRANPANPRGLPREALFDMETDPGEEVNLVRTRPRLAAAMSRRLDQLRAAGKGGTVEAPPVALDEETAEHLRALGYLQ